MPSLSPWPGRMAWHTPSLVTSQDDRAKGNQRNTKDAGMKRTYKNPFIPTKAQLDLRKSIRDYKIWAHLLEYGDPVDDGFYSISKMAIALYPAIQSKEEAATLLEGIRIFKEASDYNAWRKSYTKPVNEAMDVILRRFPTLPTDIAVKAVQQALETA